MRITKPLFMTVVLSGAAFFSGAKNLSLLLQDENMKEI
jgi:hypothetical protein